MKQLDDTGKFIFLSKNENKTMIKKLSEYVYELFNERYRISNFMTRLNEKPISIFSSVLNCHLCKLFVS